MTKKTTNTINDDQYMDQYLKKVNLTQLDNLSHKEKLWAELDREIISKEKKITIFNLLDQPFLKYTISFASIIVVLMISTVIYFTGFKNNGINVYCEIKKGTFAINNKKIEKSIVKKIKSNDIIETNNNSEVILTLYKNTSINLSENTLVNINNLSRIKNDYQTNISFKKGKIECEVHLPSKFSSFNIKSDIADFYITGTMFTIENDNDMNIKLVVKKGSVLIKNYVVNAETIKRLKNKNSIINGSLQNLASKSISVSPQTGSITINKNTVNMINKKLNDLLANYKNNDKINSIEMKNIQEEIENINKLSETAVKENSEELNLKDNKNQNDKEIKKELILSKISFKSDITLREEKISITNIDDKILITSDYDTKIYCIDPVINKLLWSYTDPEIKNIMSKPVFYKNEIVFCTNTNIYILGKNGSLKKKFGITKGPDYFCEPQIINKILYIPVSQNIYKYDGVKIEPLNDLKNTLGQLYISNYKNILYITDLNSQKITSYDLKNNIIIHTYAKTQSRTFISPIITDQYLFTADIDGNIYRYNLNTPDKNPAIINAGSGITSLHLYKNNLFFIAADGYFYKLNILTFKLNKKIIKVDNNSNINKNFYKNIIEFNNKLYYSSDTGNIFYYDLESDNANFIQNKENTDNIPLIVNPILIKNKLYFLDTNVNIYQLVEEEI